MTGPAKTIEKTPPMDTRFLTAIALTDTFQPNDNQEGWEGVLKGMAPEPRSDSTRPRSRNPDCGFCYVRSATLKNRVRPCPPNAHAGARLYQEGRCGFPPRRTS